MQIRDLRYVVAVAEEGGFSKAAVREHVSQPALSQLIQRLEGELGLKLFNRRNNKVVLTAAGEVFVEDARNILVLTQQLLNKMSQFNKDFQEELSVAIAPYYQRIYLNYVLSDFHKVYPDIRIQIIDGFTLGIRKMVCENLVDIAVCCNDDSSRLRDSIEQEGCDYIELFSEGLELAIPPVSSSAALKPFYEKKECRISDLASLSREPFVIVQKGRILHDRIIHICKAAGFSPRIIVQAGSSESVNDMICQGIGIGIVQSTMKHICSASQRAVYIPIRDAKAIRHFGLLYKPETISNGVRMFIHFVSDWKRQLPGIQIV
jgi:LysR family hydrogen peroxide-inducible transcriptional activator